MTAKQQESTGASAQETSMPTAETSHMAGATDKESLMSLSKEQLVEYLQLQQGGIDTLKRRLTLLQGQLGKQQSVSLKWGAKEQDIANVEVKTYGMTGLQAANETISTMVSSLYTLQKLGFLSGAEGIQTLPEKLKGLDLSELSTQESDE